MKRRRPPELFRCRARDRRRRQERELAARQSRDTGTKLGRMIRTFFEILGS